MKNHIKALSILITVFVYGSLFAQVETIVKDTVSKKVQAVADTVKQKAEEIVEEVPELPSNFFSSTLPNGLEVMVIEDKTVPLATVELAVKNGSFTETDEYNGISHLYEHLFFKANNDLPSQDQFMNKVKELGLVYNSATGHEKVNYYITVNSSKLFDGLTFINSAARYPLFLAEEIQKENAVVENEFQRQESNPVFYLMDELNRRLWGQNYSRKNLIGNKEVIRNATPEKMRAVKERYYHPNNSILIITGDVRHNDVFANVQTIFGDWGEVANPFTTFPIPEFDPIKESQQFITLNEMAKVPIFLMGMHGPDTRNDIKMTYAADVLTVILGQNSSRFQKTLIESGLAYQADFKYTTNKYTAPIMISFVPNPNSVEKALALLIDQLNTMDSETYFTDEEIQMAKDRIEMDDQFSKEKTSAYSHRVSQMWAISGIPYYTEYMSNIKKVTRMDLQEFVRKYIKNKPNILGALVSEKLKADLGLDNFFASTKKLDDFKLYFKPYQMELDSASFIVVEKISKWMTINPKQKIVINGWADFTGPEKLNMKLSANRAKSVFRKLITMGVDSTRMRTKARGEGPIVVTKDEKAQWRRIDLEIWRPETENGSSSSTVVPQPVSNTELSRPVETTTEKTDTMVDKAINKSAGNPVDSLQKVIKKNINDLPKEPSKIKSIK